MFCCVVRSLGILERAGVVTGSAPDQIIRNWNGDPSPAVHQLDRFEAQGQELDGLDKRLRALQGLVG